MDRTASERLRPEHILKKGSQFQAVFKARQRYQKGSLLIHYAENTCGHDRIGLAVSRKVGNAVQRNKAKRRIREIFRTNRSTQPPWLDLVIRPAPSIRKQPFKSLTQDWQAAINAVKNRLTK